MWQFRAYWISLIDLEYIIFRQITYLEKINVFSDCSMCTARCATRKADRPLLNIVAYFRRFFLSCKALTARWQHYFLPSQEQDGKKPFNPAAAAECMRLAGCTLYAVLGLFDWSRFPKRWIKSYFTQPDAAKYLFCEVKMAILPQNLLCLYLASM